MTSVSDTLSVIGLLFDLAGALSMASGFVSAVRLPDLLKTLFTSLLSKELARGTELLSSLNDQHTGAIVRGLALLVIGFLLQLIAVLIR